MGTSTHSKEEKQYSIILVHLFSGRDKQWRKVQMWFFRPANYLCILINYEGHFGRYGKTWFSIFQSIGEVIVMFVMIGYFIGADLRVAI